MASHDDSSTELSCDKFNNNIKLPTSLMSVESAGYDLTKKEGKFLLFVDARYFDDGHPDTNTIWVSFALDTDENVKWRRRNGLTTIDYQTCLVPQIEVVQKGPTKNMINVSKFIQALFISYYAKEQECGRDYYNDRSDQNATKPTKTKREAATALFLQFMSNTANEEYNSDKIQVEKIFYNACDCGLRFNSFNPTADITTKKECNGHCRNNAMKWFFNVKKTTEMLKKFCEYTYDLPWGKLADYPIHRVAYDQAFCAVYKLCIQFLQSNIVDKLVEICEGKYDFATDIILNQLQHKICRIGSQLHEICGMIRIHLKIKPFLDFSFLKKSIDGFDINNKHEAKKAIQHAYKIQQFEILHEEVKKHPYICAMHKIICNNEAHNCDFPINNNIQVLTDAEFEAYIKIAYTEIELLFAKIKLIQANNPNFDAVVLLFPAFKQIMDIHEEYKKGLLVKTSYL
jgi:hypothetical protein